MKPLAKNALRFLPGDIVEVTLTQGKVALIDVVDLPKIAEYRWCAHLKMGRYYASAHPPGGGLGARRVFMHQLILGEPWVDHKNGSGLDNRRDNLRRATRAQNTQNKCKSKSNTSGYKGVWREPRNREGRQWRAKIEANGKAIYLGPFATAEEAAHAHDDAALKLHGEFASLNFPKLH